MRIIEPGQFKTVKYREANKPRKLHPLRWIVSIIIAASLVIGTVRFRRPLPPLKVNPVAQTYNQKDVTITWPKDGQAAIGAVGYGLLKSNHTDKAVPTASVIKLATALAVLERKPFNINEPGENVPITDADVAIYQYYIARGGSTARVVAGSSLTEYQALQALLLPSANNVADTLTNWAFGSQADYLAFANPFVKKLGLTNTTITDASGFSPTTTSTASDLVNLGIAALQNPVLAQIVSQPYAEIPNAGTIHNTNLLLGQNGIVGVKTGHTNEAGGCYIVASTQSYDGGHSVTTVAAIMAAPTIAEAMTTSKPLLTQTQQGFGDTIVVHKGQKIGKIISPWGNETSIVSSQDITMFGWQAGVPKIQAKLAPPSSLDTNAKIGSAEVTFGYEKRSITIKQYSTLPSPSVWWKLRRVFTD